MTLTPDGERLLVRARDLVARHDAVWADVHVPAAKPTVVDLMSGGRLTGTRILDLARAGASSVDFRGRYTGGTGAALEGLATGSLDVVLGRVEWLDAPPTPTIKHVLVRLEPLAVSCPPRIRWPSWKGSQFAAFGGSRSMGCRPIRTHPNGST